MSVDEGRERRTLRKDEQRADEEEHHEDRQQPELLSLSHERPQLTHQIARLAHGISSSSKLSVEITGRLEITRRPDRRRSARDQCVAPDRPTENTHWRNHHEVHDAHEDRRRDL